MVFASAVCPAPERILTLASVDRILGAISDGIHVASGAADGIASRRAKSGSNQRYGDDLLEHPILLFVAQ